MRDVFEKKYWDKNYSELTSMDGIGNARDHAHYLESLLKLEMIDVSSIVDWGAGLGFLFEEMIKTFLPYKALAIEPSSYAFSEMKKRNLFPVHSMKTKTVQTDLLSWCQDIKNRKRKMRSFDLGLCTSVFQYLSEEEIDEVLPVMSQMSRYMYFTVPTDIELKRQVEELDFFDEYALRRTSSWYKRKLKPYFSVVSCRVLESRFYFSEKDTFFTELLYRF